MSTDAQHARRTPLNIASSVLGWVFLAAMSALLLAAIVIPRAAGATPYTVLTGSMQPSYPPGALVVVKPVAFEDIRIDDVVTYQLESGKPMVITHRVVGIEHGSDGDVRLVTQGDANNVADAATVREAQVKGEVWYAIPYVGQANSWLTGGTREVVVYTSAGLLLTYAAYMFLTSFGRRPSEKLGKGRTAS